MNDEDLQYKEPTTSEWRGFWMLVAVQAQNAFNEKAVQFLLIPLGVWLWGTAGSTLEYTLGAIFVLPYILFSPFVGWLSDCFCKTRIIQVMSIVQCVIIASMLFCFFQRDMTAAIMWFSIFAVQATILSPAKKGIVKDLLGSKYIGFGSGIIEMSLVFVLLAAQIGVFFWFGYLLESYSTQPDAEEMAGWYAVRVPTIVFLSLSILIAGLSFFLPRYKSLQTRKFSYSLFYEHFGQVKYLWKDRLLRLSELGISYFWCLAGSLFLIIIQIAKQLNELDPSVDFSQMCGILMAWMTGGVVIGGGIASRLCMRKNELGLIPFGAIGITISTFLLVCFETNTLGSNIMLALTGGFGALYLVPLNAFLQDHCDPANRGNIIAAGNLIDNLMGLVAVALMWVLHEFGASPQMQFFVLFLMSVFIMVTSLRLIPQEFIRMVGLWFMRCIYRPRVINIDRLPERGGALIVANHVTYADAIFLCMVSPRPVRFIVAEEFMGVSFVGWILEIFNSLPISSKNPREAIVNAAQGIEAGELICIFPEGQLTRTGCLTPIRRGMELIARRTKAPIIPIYMDKLWGSIFSFHRNRFFTKMPRQAPYHFCAAIGEKIAPEHFSAEMALHHFRALSANCLETTDGGGRESLLQALESMKERTLVYCADGEMSANQVAHALTNRTIPDDVSPLAATWLELLLKGTEDMITLHRNWLNASQVRRVNALKEGNHHLLTTVGHDEPHEMVLAVFWPIMTKTPVHLMGNPSEAIEGKISQIIGSACMRRMLFKSIPPRPIPFFDFSNGRDMSIPNMKWRPCFSTSRGCIISMSMGKSIYKLYDGTIQLGTRPRTKGLLLPGFATRKAGDSIALTSPSLAAPYMLPDCVYLDESGFLAELSS